MLTCSDSHLHTFFQRNCIFFVQSEFAVLDIFGIFHFDIAMIFQYFHRPDDVFHHFQFQQVTGFQFFGRNFFFIIQEQCFFAVCIGIFFPCQAVFCRICLQTCHFFCLDGHITVINGKGCFAICIQFHHHQIAHFQTAVSNIAALFIDDLRFFCQNDGHAFPCDDVINHRFFRIQHTFHQYRRSLSRSFCRRTAAKTTAHKGKADDTGNDCQHSDQTHGLFAHAKAFIFLIFHFFLLGFRNRFRLFSHRFYRNRLNGISAFFRFGFFLQGYIEFFRLKGIQEGIGIAQFILCRFFLELFYFFIDIVQSYGQAKVLLILLKMIIFHCFLLLRGKNYRFLHPLF